VVTLAGGGYRGLARVLLEDKSIMAFRVVQSVGAAAAHRAVSLR
jgi:hypothetical protein